MGTLFSPLGGAETAEDPQAAFEAGKRFASGQGTKRDLVKAAFYLEKAAGAERPPRGAFLLAGRVNMERKRYKEAYAFLEKAAHAGEHEAWKNLGDLYALGKGIDAPHPRWACLCYKAAYRKTPSPQLEYAIGLMVARSGDRKEAEKWMKKAAAGNHAPARKFLADPKSFEKLCPRAAGQEFLP